MSESNLAIRGGSGDSVLELTEQLQAEAATTSPRRRIRGRRDYGALLGAIWLALVIIGALLADILPLPEPDAISADLSVRPFTDPSHLLGTDNIGRDLLTRLVHGARVSMSVAVLGTLLSMVLGVVIGMVAGFVGGRVDGALSFVINFLLSFPPLIFLIALVAALQPSIPTLVIGLGMLGVPNFARVARANTIAFADREFVTAAKALGASPLRVLVRELLPNVMVPVMSLTLVVMATLVVAEGALSFLGLGVPPPAPTWGGMIAAGREQLANHPHIVLVPAAVFFLTVFAFNRLGDYARGRIGRESALG